MRKLHAASRIAIACTYNHYKSALFSANLTWALMIFLAPVRTCPLTNGDTLIATEDGFEIFGCIVSNRISVFCGFSELRFFLSLQPYLSVRLSETTENLFIFLTFLCTAWRPRWSAGSRSLSGHIRRSWTPISTQKSVWMLGRFRLSALLAT